MSNFVATAILVTPDKIIGGLGEKSTWEPHKKVYTYYSSTTGKKETLYQRKRISVATFLEDAELHFKMKTKKKEDKTDGS